MGYNLEWVWGALLGILDDIRDWWNGIWSEVQQVENTGQGLLGGLIALGSLIGDAISKAFQPIATAISSLYTWIIEGLQNLGKAIGENLFNAYQWLTSGIQWLAHGLYSIGQWLWNASYTIMGWVANAMTGFITWISEIISGFIIQIVTWWSNVISGVNTWFTNLLKVFRQKIITTITADIGISGMWKAGERILHPSGIKDIGYGLLGLILSPLVGYAIGRFVDAIVPMPSTETYPLIPTVSGLSYTPPAISIPTPSMQPAPTPITPTTPYPTLSPYYTLLTRSMQYDVTQPMQTMMIKTISYSTKEPERNLISKSVIYSVEEAPPPASIVLFA